MMIIFKDNGGERRLLKVKCPFCHETVEFKQEDTLPGLNVLTCPKCNQTIVCNNISEN